MWQGLFDGFERHLSISKRPRTVAGYRKRLEDFRRYLSEDLGLDIEPAGYTLEHVEMYVVAMQEAGLANNTRRNAISALKTFERFLLDRSEISRNRLDRLPWPKLERQPVAGADHDDLRKLLRTCRGKTLEDRRDYALLGLLLHCGPRTHEAAGMVRSDVDLKGATALFHGKGGRTYKASLHPRLVDALDAYLWLRKDDQVPALWIAVRGYRRHALTGNGILQMVKRRAKQAGVEHMNVHLIRHTVAMEHKRRGMRDDEMTRVMGWSPGSRMPDYYTAAELDERAREAQRTHSLLDRM